MAAVQMLQLAPAVAGADQVGWIVVSEDRQGLIEFILLDIAVRSEISTRGTSCDEIFPRQ